MSESSFHWFDYVVFSVTLLVSLGIGVFQACTGGKQKSTKEYLLGNKQMKVLPVAISMLMSGLSGKKATFCIECLCSLVVKYISNVYTLPNLLHFNLNFNKIKIKWSSGLRF